MNPANEYFMEGKSEHLRLKFKTDYEETMCQLKLTGLLDIRSSGSILDAGSGSGAVSQIIIDSLKKAKKNANLTLLDMSAERLIWAQKMLRPYNKVKISFLEGSLNNIPIKSNSQDYVFCRFVFEYLSEPKTAFNELYRVTRKGGKIVVGDLDNNCLTHYKLDHQLEKNLQELSDKLMKKHLIDPWIGRKLYSFFQEKKLKEIDVHLRAHHLFFGKLHNVDFANWTLKLDAVINYQKRNKIQLSFDAKKFKRLFLSFLRSSARFSYTPIIIVEGIKA